MSEASAPILLFGMPRSGTTWLGKIFDSHPRVLYRHEPDSWRRLEMPIIACPVEQVRYERVLREYIESMPSIRADRVCGKRPQFPKEYASAWAIHRHAVGAVLRKALARAGFETPAPTPPQPVGIFNEVAFGCAADNPRNRVLYYEALCAAPEDTTRDAGSPTSTGTNRPPRS
jgi:Sulfotransferase family